VSTRMRALGAIAGYAVAAALTGCEPQRPPVADPPRPSPTVGPAATVAKTADPLGPKPSLGAARPFTPPAPEVFQLENGMTVWLLERRSLPMVAVTVAVPTGSAADPPDLPGLCHITAGMLDEGAGKRSAVEVSSAINDLGASLSVGNTADGSFASVTVLKKNFGPAFAILGDVVVRPRFEPKEFARVSKLWQNDLKKRADDPAAVSRVVSLAAVYGAGTPYGHPTDGLFSAAARVQLPQVKAFYSAHFRPERAILVVAGDVSRAEVTAAANEALRGWKSATAAPAAKESPPARAPEVQRASGRRVILVDRPGAPQSVVALVRPSVSSKDPALPKLELINTALGGSFTSRLNQNLREDHGWSYGARSAFTEVRGEGAFIARAAVLTDKTGPSMKEMLHEIQKMADEGLTADELAKVRAQDRAELVQTYETVGGVAGRLGTLAVLGLAPGYDAVASRARQEATLAELAALGRAWLDPTHATLVIVGPRTEVMPQLSQLGLPEPEIWTPEGREAGARETGALRR
jgi:zinc protease